MHIHATSFPRDMANEVFRSGCPVEDVRRHVQYLNILQWDSVAFRAVEGSLVMDKQEQDEAKPRDCRARALQPFEHWLHPST